MRGHTQTARAVIGGVERLARGPFQDLPRHVRVVHAAVVQLVVRIRRQDQHQLDGHHRNQPAPCHRHGPRTRAPQQSRDHEAGQRIERNEVAQRAVRREPVRQVAQERDPQRGAEMAVLRRAARARRHQLGHDLAEHALPLLGSGAHDVEPQQGHCRRDGMRHPRGGSQQEGPVCPVCQQHQRCGSVERVGGQRLRHERARQRRDSERQQRAALPQARDPQARDRAEHEERSAPDAHEPFCDLREFHVCITYPRPRGS